jgi:hypothetical protein
MNPVGAILNNFWAKVISLILAVATWFYVFDIVTSVDDPRKKDDAGKFFSSERFIARDIPIRPVLFGKPKSGYRLDMEKVRVEPGTISMLLPESIAYSVKELRTEPVDLGEYTKPASLRSKVFSDSKLLRMDRKLVDIFIPIEKEAAPQGAEAPKPPAGTQPPTAEKSPTGSVK